MIHLVLVIAGLVAASLSLAEPLKFWAVTGSIEDVEMYRRLADDFEKTSGVKVEVTPLAWGNFQTKYFAAMAAGMPPDAGITNLGGPFDYGSVGGLVALNKAFPIESTALLDDFYPGQLEIFKVDDKVFAVPSDVTTLVLYCRTDIFRNLGLRPPSTWSELNKLIGDLEAKDFQFYFGFTAQAQWAAGLYTMPYHLPGIHPDAAGRPVVDWDDPRYQSGILEAMRLWHMHDSPGKDLGGRAIGLFAESDPGKACPLMADMPSVASQIHITKPELDGKWAIVPWPKADDGETYNVMGGTSFVIFRQSRHQKEAFDWIKFLNTPDIQRRMTLDHLARGLNASLSISPLKAMWQPANNDFWANPELKSSLDQINVLKDVISTMKTVRSLHGAADVGRMESSLLDAMATSIQDQLGQLAAQKGLSKSQLIHSWGRGENLTLQASLEASVKSKLREGYAKITPVALAKLNLEADRYESRFGTVVLHLPEYERRSSALTFAKIFAAALLLAGIGAVAGFPRLRKHWLSYLFVATPLSLALIFVFIPALVALYLAFTEYHPVLPLSTARWVGFSNFQELVASGNLSGSLYRTLIYSVLTLPVGILLALFFAFLLNGQKRCSRLWRFLYFSPIVTSIVSISLIFTQLFLGSKQGWLNSILLQGGLIKDPVPFLTSERTFLPCVIILAVWHGLAFTILVFLAGFQQVPLELFESAAVDGAGPARRFWNIAVPGIRPQVFFISVLGLIGSFQVFETIYMMSNKSGDAGAKFGPNDGGMTVVPLLYHLGFETFEMGKSAALAYILFLIILLLTFLQTKVYQRGEA